MLDWRCCVTERLKLETGRLGKGFSRKAHDPIKVVAGTCSLNYTWLSCALQSANNSTRQTEYDLTQSKETQTINVRLLI